MILVPFKNGWTEKSCRNWSFVVFPKKWSFVVFPKSGRLWCFPKGNKGVFRTTGDRGQNFFWGVYGYPMGTLNSQTHFKIGDSSL